MATFTSVHVFLLSVLSSSVLHLLQLRKATACKWPLPFGSGHHRPQWPSVYVGLSYCVHLVMLPLCSLLVFVPRRCFSPFILITRLAAITVCCVDVLTRQPFYHPMSSNHTSLRSHSCGYEGDESMMGMGKNCRGSKRSRGDCRRNGRSLEGMVGLEKEWRS